MPKKEELIKATITLAITADVTAPRHLEMSIERVKENISDNVADLVLDVLTKTVNGIAFKVRPINCETNDSRENLPKITPKVPNKIITSPSKIISPHTKVINVEDLRKKKNG